MYMRVTMKQKRSFRDGHKRIVAARQEWKCASCSIVLPSAFQVDHIIPLWRDGEDSIDNAQALCPTCHAQKTQREEIARHEEKRKHVVESAKQAQLDFEKSVYVEEYGKQKLDNHKNGKYTCSECALSFYTIFKHDTCHMVEKRIHARLFPNAKEPNPPNPFDRFRFTGS